MANIELINNSSDTTFNSDQNEEEDDLNLRRNGLDYRYESRRIKKIDLKNPWVVIAIIFITFFIVLIVFS